MIDRKLYQTVELDQIFNEFADTKKPDTRHCYKTYLKQWILFSGLNGKETLALKQNDKDAETEKKAVAFKMWLQEQGTAETSSQTAVGCLRGFFAYNRIPLVFIGSERKTLKEANRKTKDYLFTKEDFCKMVNQGSLVEKYVILMGKSVGLRASDFLNITFGELRGLNLNAEPPLSLGETVTKKEHVLAYPFIDSDCVPIVKAVLERSPDAKDSDRVLDYTEDNLTQIIQRLMVKAHLETHGKIARFHNLRKYLIDRLSAVASESQWKQIVGKKISESAYVSQEQLRSIYLRAMPSIVINGNGKNHVAIEGLREEITTLKSSIGSLKKENFNVKFALDTLVRELNSHGIKINLSKMLEEHASKYSEESEKET